MRFKKPRFNNRAWGSNKPAATSIPASAKMAKPLPATCGLGSTIAAITFATPAAFKPSAQGGVRPKWLHGSRVT